MSVLLSVRDLKPYFKTERGGFPALPLLQDGKEPKL